MNKQQSEIYLTKFYNILGNMSYRMISVEMINNITINFIRTMIPHHQAAIYMCQNLLNYTNNQKLITIAQNIISMQQRGINQMKEILETTPEYISNTNQINDYLDKYYRILNRMTVRMRKSLQSPNIDLDFISEMIPHHEGAIEMCQNLLEYPIDKRLEKVAQNIIDEQSKGVEELKQVRSNLQSK